jgi:hypothetical protein
MRAFVGDVIMVEIRTRDMAKILTDRQAKMKEMLEILRTANVPIEIILFFGQIMTEDKMILDYANELIAADDIAKNKNGQAKPAAKPSAKPTDKPAAKPSPLDLGPKPIPKSDEGQLIQSKRDEQMTDMIKIIQLAGSKGFNTAEIQKASGLEYPTVANILTNVMSMKDTPVERFKDSKNKNAYIYRIRNTDIVTIDGNNGGRDMH